MFVLLVFEVIVVSLIVLFITYLLSCIWQFFANRNRLRRDKVASKLLDQVENLDIAEETLAIQEEILEKENKLRRFVGRLSKKSDSTKSKGLDEKSYVDFYNEVVGKKFSDISRYDFALLKELKSKFGIDQSRVVSFDTEEVSGQMHNFQFNGSGSRYIVLVYGEDVVKDMFLADYPSVLGSWQFLG